MLVCLKDRDWLEKQRIAGSVVAGILRTLNQIIVDKIPNLSLRDLEAEALRQIIAGGCTSTFKGYKGFPGEICLSVNQNVVHGIPDDYKLQSGDVVKFDLGATYCGVIADAAATAIYGEPKSNLHVDLLDVCRGALDAGIAAIQVGRQLGCIGYAINKYVQSRSNFKLITNYGGHGICINPDGTGIPHASPFVSNRSKPNEGIRIQPGLSIAIEPMLVLADTADTVVLDDGWTVKARGISAHFEHSVFVQENKVNITTKWQ